MGYRYATLMGVKEKASHRNAKPLSTLTTTYSYVVTKSLLDLMYDLRASMTSLFKEMSLFLAIFCALSFMYSGG